MMEDTHHYFHVHHNSTFGKERQYPLDFGNEGFMVFGSSLLWFMIPGCGLFYSGMAKSTSALSMMTLSLWSIAIASIQWFLFGYSLSFSLTSHNSFIGDFNKAFYIGVREEAYPTAVRISEISFCFYQGVTSTLPAALLSGALAERARILPALVFIFLWNTFVYCPCAFWSLNPNGWSFQTGVLDFGGGAPVHVPASAAAIAYCYHLGPRTQEQKEAKPHNMAILVLGTIFIWFGSFGYNSGSAFGATLQAVFSCVVTNLSGSIGSITWAFQDYLSNGKCTAFGFCAGAVIGLIVITPASGFVHPAAAFPIAIIGTVVCRWGHLAKTNWKFDDTLDVFAMHGLAGIVGILLTGVFAHTAYGGEEIGLGGMVEGHYMQILYQLADTCAGFTWSISVSFFLLFIMNKIPFLRLRMEPEHAREGMDLDQMGIACYEHIEEIKIQVDTATWKIDPTDFVDKKQHKQDLIILNPQTIHQPVHQITNNHNYKEAQIYTDQMNEEEKDFVPPNNWRNYWY